VLLAEDTESDECHLGAIIVRDLSSVVSNYRSQKSLDQYCKEQNVIGISDVDTRQLTKLLRNTGCLVGAISTDASKTDAELLEMTKSWTIVGKDLLSVVSCTEPYEWQDPTKSEWEFNSKAKASHSSSPYLVVAYDFGIKHNILRRLASFGCKIIVVPATYPASEVLKMNPDGVFFSNGPGDPSAAPYAVENAKEILGKKPTFGICMGHQLLGQAFGGELLLMPLLMNCMCRVQGPE
jgi:carbamoyl-phosphate synthase small subunit